MSQQRGDLVVAYLETLYRQRELVAAAYHRGSVSRSDGLGTARGIYELHQHRTLVPYTQESFRLASSLIRHLDEVLQKEQLYAAVGANIVELVERLHLLIDDTVKAHLEGRTEDADSYVDHFNNAVFELADCISNALQYLRMLADSRFANVSTLAEKRRQNEYYVGRAEKISDALKAMATSGIVDTLSDNSACEPLAVAFRHQIWDRLPEWRASLLDITDILKSYLYRLRQVEPAARKFRAFALFLKRNPDYVTPNVDEMADLPAWAERAAALHMRARPDLTDSGTQEMLVEIAKSIPAAQVPIKRVPRIGSLLPDDGRYDTVMAIKLNAYQRALKCFLLAVPEAEGMLSALDWKRRHPEFNELLDDIWMLCVLYEFGLNRKRHQPYRVERIEASANALAGNIVVRDIQVRRRRGLTEKSAHG
jgi:hypothetical protein